MEIAKRSKTSVWEISATLLCRVEMKLTSEILLRPWVHLGQPLPQLLAHHPLVEVALVRHAEIVNSDLGRRFNPIVCT